MIMHTHTRTLALTDSLETQYLQQLIAGGDKKMCKTLLITSSGKMDLMCNILQLCCSS